MLRNWQFTLPTKIQFGRGGLRKLGATTRPLGAKALLVSYATCAALDDARRQAAKSLADAGIAVGEFYEAPPEPTVDVAAAGAEAARRVDAQVIVALGGGSVIDVAKGIALLAKLGGSLGDFAASASPRRPIDDALPVVALPTTAGTGAEVTQVAVFGDGQAKLSLSAPRLRPAIAVVDPELTLGCPAEVTAACGADALGHAIEACMSRAANPISTALGVQAVGIIVGNLPRAVAEPGNRDAREALAAAATLAGLALNESGLTMTHAIAHALGAMFDMPHGHAVAIATPLNLRYNLDACRDVYAQLALRCCIALPAEELPEAFVDRIADLLRTIGLRDRIAASTKDREALAMRLAENAFRTTPQPLRLNPRPIDEPALCALIAAELL